MERSCRLLLLTSLLAGCAAERGLEPLNDYEEVSAATTLGAPDAEPGKYAANERDRVFRGKYMVELLGCAVCHTDGALIGEPNAKLELAGSQVGIAFSNPLGDNRPGIVYPANITPDIKTGIGAWSDAQIARAIRTGQGRHGNRRIAVMPWQGYAKLSGEDVDAIVAYLRSIRAVRHQVPDEVPPGARASAPFVYFGVYQRR